MAYANGMVPLGELEHLGGNHYLPRGTAARWRWLVKQGQERHGVTFRITPDRDGLGGWNGYRPFSAQVAYKAALGDRAAAAGKSSHGGWYGAQEVFAIDVDNWQAVSWDEFKKLAQDAGFRVDFVSPSERWHIGDFNDPWTVPAFTAAAPFDPTPILEDTMSSNPVINVVPTYNPGNPDHWKNGTLYVGLDDGSFEALRPPFATNIRGIIGAGFFGSGDGGNQNAIPTLSQADFNALATVWATMCKGRTDASAVWAEGVHAQDAEGRGLYIDANGAITTTKTDRPLKFTAAGYLASTNALANAASEG